MREVISVIVLDAKLLFSTIRGTNIYLFSMCNWSHGVLTFGLFSDLSVVSLLAK